MNRVVVYSTSLCPYCMMTRRLLDAKGVAYEELRVDRDPQLREAMVRLSGRRSVPQIFIGTQHVGGHQELAALDRSGQLDQLLHAT